MQSRRSRSVGKKVFDDYRNFFTKNRRYRTTKTNLFNFKEETGIKPRRMTPQLWKLEYNRNSQGKKLVYVPYILMFYNYNLY